MKWDTIENRWKRFQNVLMDLEFTDDDNEESCTSGEHLERVAILQERVFREASYFGEADDEFTVETEELDRERAGDEGRWQDAGGAGQNEDVKGPSEKIAATLSN
jgi:hypothetical protein